MRFFLSMLAICMTATFAFSEPPDDGDTKVPAADIERVAKLLAGNPTIVDRARIPELKVVQIADANSVVLRTDRVMLTRMLGAGIYDDRHTPPERLKLLVGGRCMVGGGHQWQELTLLKIERNKAVFQRVSHPRAGGEVVEVVAVAPYEDGRWAVDSKDATRVTYTEFDEKGKKRMEKQYRNDRLDGTWTEWNADGRKESEKHFVHDWRDGTWLEWHANGRKRHEVHYRDDVAIGRELWWDASGNVAAIGEHPDKPRPVSENASKDKK